MGLDDIILSNAQDPRLYHLSIFSTLPDARSKTYPTILVHLLYRTRVDSAEREMQGELRSAGVKQCEVTYCNCNCTWYAQVCTVLYTSENHRHRRPATDSTCSDGSRTRVSHPTGWKKWSTVLYSTCCRNVGNQEMWACFRRAENVCVCCVLCVGGTCHICLDGTSTVPKTCLTVDRIGPTC